MGKGKREVVGERELVQMGAKEERRGKVGEKPRSRRYTNIVLEWERERGKYSLESFICQISRMYLSQIEAGTIFFLFSGKEFQIEFFS